MSCIGTPARKALEGRHTPSGMSPDSHRRGELSGLVCHVDGINDPPTEDVLGSRKTLLRGTIANQQLVRPSPQGSSVDICVQCSHWTHTVKPLLVMLPKGRRTKGLQYDRLWCDRRNFGDVPCTRVQKGFGHAGHKVQVSRGH